MISMDLYCKGTKVWIPNLESVWLGGTIADIIYDSKICRIQTDYGSIIEIKYKNGINDLKDKLPYLRNPIILIGQKNLTSLSYLNEPEVLYNLQIRFIERKEIYTYCGIVLVAINPYQELPIYGNGIIDTYHSQNFIDLDPHIFAVAESAFRRMSSFNENQSIIVSGESGAGKTVSAKYAMRYFSIVGGSKSSQLSHFPNETNIERKVLSSNPVMEAMGNAKTIRNDNSSRFGKYLQIEFSPKNQIISANMRTYLLEKSRVVFQNLGERNYHIFYQLVCQSQSEDDLLVNTGLVDNPDNYSYLNCGESLEIDGVDDAHEFAITKNSFLQLGFETSELKIIYEILAAILHLGNIQFVSDEAEDGCEIKNVELLKLACQLLGCSSDQMEIWLRFRSISTLQETLHKPLTKDEARYFRDALSKSIYENLFIWIVTKINHSLSKEKFDRKSKRSKPSSHDQCQSQRFIGVLDIYGFETFAENSFEQFCINFANEKLQQQFNLHVFKLEQEEYLKEGLEWTFIDYYNNQPCIDLIEGKLGLFDLLDEECKMLKGSDENWCCKIYKQHLQKSNYFSKPKMSNESFIINHFADQVQYECYGFIEKNRDTILEEQINLLKASEVLIVSELFSSYETESSKWVDENIRSNVKVTQQLKLTQAAKLDNSRKMKRTVGYQFRDSLRQLMDNLNQTNPHYVRCIKPNDLKLPFTFCPKRAVQQLRACGVLETIRLSAAGYPSRWTYFDFFSRYSILLSQKVLQGMDVKQGSEVIVKSLIKIEEAYKLGHTKIFFRPGRVAYLEKLRSDKISYCATLIQKSIRGWIVRKSYLKILRSVVKVQSLIRRKIAFETAKKVRINRAATKIQSVFQMHFHKRKYEKLLKSTKAIQKWWKLRKRIEKNKVIKREKQIIICQSVVRSFICRRQYASIMRAIILIQCHFRRRKAKAELLRLKIEARSVVHIRVINKGLENKIIELTQRLNEKDKEIGLINNRIEKDKRLAIEAQKQFEAKNTMATKICTQSLQTEISLLKKELNKEFIEKKVIYIEKETLDNNYKKKIMDLEEMIDRLKYQIKILEEETLNKDEEIGKLKNKSSAIDATSEKLIREKLDHQALIRDYANLDAKYQNLCREFDFVKSCNERMRIDQVDPSYSGYSASDDDSGSLKSDADVESASDYESKSFKKLKSVSGTATKIIEGTAHCITTAGDLAVIMQLQLRINGQSQENNQLRERIQELENKMIECKESYLNKSENLTAADRFDSELYTLMREMKDNDNSGTVTILIDQVDDLRKKLLMQMYECQRLKTNIFNERLCKLGESINSGICCNVNEDGEWKLAFQSQKDANRKMLEEIEDMKSIESVHRKEIIQLKREKENLHIQMGKQQLIIKRGLTYIIKSQNMKLAPKERIDKFVQNELSRILSENMKLHETTDKVIAESIQLKRGLKYFAHKLQKYEGPLVLNSSKPEDLLKVVEDVFSRSRIKSDASNVGLSPVGLIDLNLSELPSFIKCYIHDMKPSVLSTFEVFHIPMFVIFMIARKFDSFKEEEKIIKFLTKVVSSFKKVVMKNESNLESLVMWMSNLFCLLNLFRQYNGKSKDCGNNNGDSRKYYFVMFDLSEFIRILSDMCISTFQLIMTYIKENLLQQSLCIDAILLYEGIKTPMSKDGVMDFQHLESQPKNTSFNILIKNLQSVLDIMKNHKVAPCIINQIFVQISYFINANCLNNLLFRADLCYFSKGVQIKFNLSNIENWLRNQKLENSDSIQCLRPMIEAVQLLQTLLRSEEDAQIICNMCDNLNSSQIVKILHNFNPQDGWGCRLPDGLIDKIQDILSSKDKGRQISEYVETPTTASVPIDLPFLYNSQPITEITVPSAICLPCLKMLTDLDLR